MNGINAAALCPAESRCSSALLSGSVTSGHTSTSDVTAGAVPQTPDVKHQQEFFFLHLTRPLITGGKTLHQTNLGYFDGAATVVCWRHDTRDVRRKSVRLLCIHLPAHNVTSQPDVTRRPASEEIDLPSVTQNSPAA